MTNLTETTIEEIDAFADRAFMDGIITGKPLAKTVGHIVEKAFLFGCDEAERRDYLPYSCNYEKMEDVRRDAVASISEGLLGGKGLRVVIKDSVRVAIAFGFKQAKARRDAKESIEVVFAEAVAAKGENGKLSVEATDKLFGTINRLDGDTAYVYIRKVLNEEKLAPDYKSEQWKLFSDKYTVKRCYSRWY